MPPNHQGHRQVLDLTYDPIREAISKQLANPIFNDLPSAQVIIERAIDFKHHRFSSPLDLIVPLRIRGLTYGEISGITGYCERQVARICKKNVLFCIKK